MERDKAIKCIYNKQKVLYREQSYIPIAYKLGLYNNQWIHSLELKDIKSNSIVVANLDRVKECGAS